MHIQAAKTAKLMLAGTALGAASLAGPIATANEASPSTTTAVALLLAERLAAAAGRRWPDRGTTCPYAGCPR